MTFRLDAWLTFSNGRWPSAARSTAGAATKNYVQVYFEGQHAYVKKSLNSVEERLPRKLFFRISRQHIVDLRAIVSIEESMSAGFRLRLDDGKILEISRRNAGELRELLSL